MFNAVVGRKNLLLTSKLKVVSLFKLRRLGRQIILFSQGVYTSIEILSFYRVDGNPGFLVDAPGYGARGMAEWGELFDEYIEKHKQYVLTTIHY